MKIFSFELFEAEIMQDNGKNQMSYSFRLFYGRLGRFIS